MIRMRYKYVTASFLVLHLAVATEEDTSFQTFLEACTEGKMDTLKVFLEAHPDWVHKRSDQGESCLHVAGIFGQELVTTAVLNAGGDPNIRSTFERGLRMHPLSWNVYHGHVGNARRLLEGGALVNLDVDHMSGTNEPVTVLDILGEILQNTPAQDPRMDQYQQMKVLLLEHGAKRYADLMPCEQEL